MTYNAYLTLVGQKQGAINGSVTEKGRENSILVHAFTNQIISPRDPASGLPSGKRQHQPLVIVKEIDKSSPALWSALVNNENLTTWVLRFWNYGVGGPEKEIYTIALTNAAIASMEESMADNTLPGNSGLPLREQLSFTYQKIQWTWTDGSVTAIDTWQPVA